MLVLIFFKQLIFSLFFSSVSVNISQSLNLAFISEVVALI